MHTILIADYSDEFHASAIVNLMDAYAMGKMGGGEALPEAVKQVLVSEMAKVRMPLRYWRWLMVSQQV